MGRSTAEARRRTWGPLPIDRDMKCSSDDVRLETRRLILRAFTIEDFDGYFALSSDPDNYLHSERGPFTSDEAWTRLLRHVGHWALLGYGLFAIEEKGSGRFIGEAGFSDFRRQLGPEFDGAPEASWSVASWAQGRGYATEAAKAALNWIETALAVPRTVCLIHRDNAPSVTVARKLGYSVIEERSYRGYPALLHERRKPGP